jgi:hypothetical protein
VSRDPFVFPEGLSIIIVLLDVLHDFIVRKNLPKFVSISHRKFHPKRLHSCQLTPYRPASPLALSG